MKTREENNEKALKILDKCPYVMIAVPANAGVYSFIVQGIRINNDIYFHSRKIGKKNTLIGAGCKASLSAVANYKVKPESFSTIFNSVHADLTIVRETDTDLKKEVLFKLCEAYAPEYIQNYNNEMEKYFNVTDIYKCQIDNICARITK